MEKKTLTQQAIDRIYKLVTIGNHFQPGDKLSGENALSEELGISRATLREALRILTTQGILEVHRGKGTFVSSDLQSFGNFGLEKLERHRARLKDLFEARLLFEPEMAALACRRATDKELTEIVRLGKITEEKITLGQDRTTADQEFHSAIVTAAHNEFMLRLLPIISHAIEEVIQMNMEYHSLAEYTLQDHALLMDFLQKRDAIGAKQVLSIHLHHAINTLQLNSVDDPLF